jgi:hypothetical protein
VRKAGGRGLRRLGLPAEKHTCLQAGGGRNRLLGGPDQSYVTCAMLPALEEDRALTVKDYLCDWLAHAITRVRPTANWEN